jgi:hypothetical protein
MLLAFAYMKPGKREGGRRKKEEDSASEGMVEWGRAVVLTGTVKAGAITPLPDDVERKVAGAPTWRGG